MKIKNKIVSEEKNTKEISKHKKIQKEKKW